MRYVLVLIGLTILAPVGRAEVVFPTTDVQAGEVKSGVPLVRRFVMVNRGPSTAEIREIQVGCGCVKPKLDPAPDKLPCTLAPGERRSVTLEVNTLSQPEGDQTWHATVVWTEGGKALEQRLTVSGKVVSEVSVQPAALFVFTDSAIKHDLTVTDRRATPLTITGLDLGSAHLKAKQRPTPPDNQPHRTYRIELDVADEVPEGRTDATLSIATSDATYAEIKVPVVVVKRGKQRIKTSPDSVWLQAPPGEPIPSRLLRVYDSSDRPIVVDKVVSEDPAVTATWKGGTDGTATVKVAVDRTKIVGTRLVTAIRVEVSQPERQTLTLPVTCVLE